MPQKQTPYQEQGIGGLVPQDSGLNPESDLIQKYIRNPLSQSGPGRATLGGIDTLGKLGEKSGLGDIGNISIPGRGIGEAATFAGGSPALRKVFDYFVKRYPRIMDKYVGFVGESKNLGSAASSAVPKGRNIAMTTAPGVMVSDIHNMRIPRGIKSDIMFDPQATELAKKGPFESYAGLGEEEKLARIMGHEVTHAVQYGRPDIMYNRLTSKTAPAIPPRPSIGMLNPEYRQSMGNVMNELEVPAYVAEGGILKNYMKRRGNESTFNYLYDPKKYEKHIGMIEEKQKNLSDVMKRLKETSERLEKFGVGSPGNYPK